LKGIHKSLNKLVINLFISAKIITTQKNISKLFSELHKPCASNLESNTLEFKGVFSFKFELSDKIELNKMKIEGMLNKFFKSVLFNKANIIIHNWDGFINVKNL
jgi:hypothetical protein